ncbi:protein kinase [Streptomyces pharetrae]|uniref:serine/threonine-protein kinase n=1 Tax=Streptomyces pharetrae TaxID=291370 RepID=UPI003660C125
MSDVPGRERLIAGRYRLLSPLGEGGMGTVWRARDELLSREVAVKEVRAPAGLPGSDVERMYARLEREAWAAARVANRNVVTVYDVATEQGRPWIVMELVRGISLAELLEADGPVAPRRAAHIGAEVLAALRAAHAAGVLHRDVKPANVLLSNDGRVVLTDFGIAMVEGSSALTMTGEVVGSPEFLAPERALGRTPGPESDLWSLGVLLYAAVEGHSPFRHDTPISTLRAIVDEELPPPRRAGPLGPVIEGLLRKEPAERLPAERAERDLRLIGAGGTPSEGGAAGGDTAPTTPYAPYTTTVSGSSPPPREPSGPTAPVPEPPPRRRAALALVAGVAVLASALAGLAYALLNRADEGGNAGGAPTATPTARQSSPGPTQEETTEDSPSPTPSATPSPSPSPSDSGPSSSPPPQSVTVTVTGARTEYSGPCPPPAGQAPRFTASFTVGRVPTEVVYQWVGEDGEPFDGGWKTLSFPAGGDRNGHDRVTVTTYDDSGTFEDAIGVEVREPVHAASEKVPFSVTCVTETPSDGVSASPGS